MAAVVAVLAFTTAVLAILVVGLLRSHGEILRALHDLGVDFERNDPVAFSATGATATPRAAPSAMAVPPAADPPDGPRGGGLPEAVDVAGLGADGSTVHVAVTGVPHPTLLAFLTTGCELCIGFWEAMADPAQRAQIGEDVRIVAVTQGEQSEMPGAVARMAPPGVTTLMSQEAWDAYNVPVAPFFALVDGETGRVVGEGAAPSWSQLVDLLGRVFDDGAGPAGRSRARHAGGGGRRWAQREADTDAALLAAGIVPGDPRLHHGPQTEPAGDDDPGAGRG